MISEFELLAEKVRRLADLTDALRRENAGLRLDLAAQTERNAGLQLRMQEAHERVAAVLGQLPQAAESEEECA